MLLTTENIGAEVRAIKPYNIAVAFIGIDWNEFIDVSRINKIILSPTIGSNPNAIEMLVNVIGWEKVYFLDKLHAKFYIGSESAILGSANLTSNGLSGEGLQEAAMKTKNSQEISELVAFFSKLELLASEQYPDVKSKKHKLNILKKQWNNAVRNSIIKPKPINSKSIKNYTPSSCDDFYITWYQKGLDYEYSENVGGIENLIIDEMHLAEPDKVEKDKWLLSWRITNKCKPYKKVMPTWIYIDEIIENGVIASDDYEYTKLALMFKNRTQLSPPFEITNEFYEAFSKLVTQKKYKPYFIGDVEPYLVSNTFSVFEEFIKEIKATITT